MYKDFSYSCKNFSRNMKVCTFTERNSSPVSRVPVGLWTRIQSDDLDLLCLALIGGSR